MRFTAPFGLAMIGGAALVAAAPADAEVVSASAGAFEISRSVTVPVTPDAAYGALGHVGRWWSSAHSYSGNAANMTLDLHAGGCFCEKLADGGSIEHMRVIAARPGRLLRLSGALGPLQAEAVAGVMSWTLAADPAGVRIVQTYSVSGHVRGGADKIAPAVDQVMGEQLQRLADYLRAARTP